jgi:hypothetical protein
MTTLTEKLDALILALGTKLDTLDTAIALTNTKLDALIASSGGTADYSSIVTAIESGTESNATWLNAVWSESLNIVNAIGNIDVSSPVGWSVRELLANLQTAVDAAPSDRNQNPSPEGEGWTRQVAWRGYGALVIGGTTYNAWCPVFAVTTQPHSLERQANESDTRYNYLCDYAGFETMQVGWNCTNHIQPAFIGAYPKLLTITESYSNAFLTVDVGADLNIYPQEGTAAIQGSHEIATRSQNAQAFGTGDLVAEWFVFYPAGQQPFTLDFWWRSV